MRSLRVVLVRLVNADPDIMPQPITQLNREKKKNRCGDPDVHTHHFFIRS